MNKIQISPAAQSDMLEIKEYISTKLQNPTAAKNIISKITNRIRDLAEFPLAGSPLASLIYVETNHRFVVCGNYAAFYRFINDMVYVDRVLYCKRDYMRILLGNVSEDEEGLK